MLEPTPGPNDQFMLCLWKSDEGDIETPWDSCEYHVGFAQAKTSAIRLMKLGGFKEAHIYEWVEEDNDFSLHREEFGREDAE